MCLLNAPGTFHNSTITNYGIYSGIEEIYNRTGGKVVVDSTFNFRNRDFIIKLSQKDPLDAYSLLVNRDYIYMYSS